MSSRLFHIFFCSLLALALLPASGKAQDYPDTISYSSTCVNTTILFASPQLDTFFRPDYIRWHFGDPASGFNDSSAASKPRHVFATPGAYAIELDVWYRNSDTIKIKDTINIVTPMNFNFGPDIFVCGKTPDTLIRGPVV
ncbi:MAG: hypothetical protein JST68_14795, partial [Bacteroidetes bacterium]|nr:hypothetical protein [Bacteroidota bacterium]